MTEGAIESWGVGDAYEQYVGRWSRYAEPNDERYSPHKQPLAAKSRHSLIRGKLRFGHHFYQRIATGRILGGLDI